jgi:REP element-mobilizing transposase RayT
MQTRSLIWNVGYFVSSIGLNEGQIKRYIDWQDKKESRPQTTRLF